MMKAYCDPGSEEAYGNWNGKSSDQAAQTNDQSAFGYPTPDHTYDSAPDKNSDDGCSFWSKEVSRDANSTEYQQLSALATKRLIRQSTGKCQSKN